MYRGEFENRLKQIIEEVKNDPNVILFVDEVHTLMGAGNASGSLDAANLFKPELARGNLRLIGATTLEEYKKHIESDPAFERRFQPILIVESTPEETEAILKGVKKNYELYHQVKISDEAIKAAVIRGIGLYLGQLDGACFAQDISISHRHDSRLCSGYNPPESGIC